MDFQCNVVISNPKRLIVQLYLYFVFCCSCIFFLSKVLNRFIMMYQVWYYYIYPVWPSLSNFYIFSLMSLISECLAHSLQIFIFDDSLFLKDLFLHYMVPFITPVYFFFCSFFPLSFCFNVDIFLSLAMNSSFVFPQVCILKSHSPLWWYLKVEPLVHN